MAPRSVDEVRERGLQRRHSATVRGAKWHWCGLPCGDHIAGRRVRARRRRLWAGFRRHSEGLPWLAALRCARVVLPHGRGSCPRGAGQRFAGNPGQVKTACPPIKPREQRRSRLGALRMGDTKGSERPDATRRAVGQRWLQARRGSVRVTAAAGRSWSKATAPTVRPKEGPRVGCDAEGLHAMRLVRQHASCTGASTDKL